MLIPIALDTETAPIEQGRQAPDLACVSIWGGGIRDLLHWTDCVTEIEALLTAPNVLIVGHTIEYDMAVIGTAFPYLLPLIFQAYRENRIVCIAVREKLLDIAKGRYRGFDSLDGGETVIKVNYSLDDISQRRLRRKLDKNTWRMQYGRLRAYPLVQWPQGAKDYPLEDGRATFDGFQDQEAERQYYLSLGQPDFLADQFRQTRKAFWLRLMSIWGICTDNAGVQELARKTRQEYDAIAQELAGAGLLWGPKPKGAKNWGKLGSRNTKAAAQRLVYAYQAQGLDIPRTPHGGPALDEQACSDSGDPLLVQYAKLSSLATVLSKDVPALSQGLIHTRWDSLKETGRTSSGGNAKSYGMNIQNIRRMPGVRECFVPRCLTCGHVLDRLDVEYRQCLRCGACLTVFVSADWSGVELCAHAQVNLSILQRSALAEAMNAGKDPHLMIAAQVLRRPYDEIKARFEAGAGKDCSKKLNSKCHCDYCTIDTARQVAKVANFGFQGGLGPKGLVAYALGNYGVRLTEDEARALKRNWLATWPEMADYFRVITMITKKDFPLIEQLYSGRWRGNVSYTEAANTMFQGLAADMAGDAGWRIAEACYVDQSSPLWGCRPVNHVHDEFIVEAPESRAHEAALELSRIMGEAAKVWMPDVKCVAKPLLMRRWSKKAKAVWEGDRLVPWDMAA